MGIKLTSEILVAGTGCDAATAGDWLEPVQNAIDKAGISSSASDTAAFLANVGVECMGFRTLVENVNYSAARLAVVFPQRYAVNPHTLNKIPNDTAVRIGGNPVLVASNLYANRMGNGSESTQDGYNYRGQGCIQITGRTAFMTFFAWADLPLNTSPAELQQPELAALSAAWFWTKYSTANDFGVQGNFAMTVERVNGQAPCAANQGPLRQSRYDATLPLCSAALAPAPTRQQKPSSQKANSTTSAPQ
jgi:putative chitinase